MNKSDWRPESMRRLDESSERLMALLRPLLRLQREEDAIPLAEALDDFVKAHMERHDFEADELRRGYW